MSRCVLRFPPTANLLSGRAQSIRCCVAGTYTLVVHDRSTIHNFHLIGPGVDVATTVEDAGDATFTVTYDDGPRENPHGSLIEGQSVKIKNGMVFNVTPTIRS